MVSLIASLCALPDSPLALSPDGTLLVNFPDIAPESALDSASDSMSSLSGHLADHLTLGDDKMSTLESASDSALERQESAPDSTLSMDLILDASSSAALDELRRRRAELSESLRPERRHVATLLPRGGTRVVFDTNCLLDAMPLIESVVDRRAAVAVIPFVVLRELDGLCLHPEKGASAEAARKRLNALFERGSPFIKAATAAGSVLAKATHRTDAYERPPGTVNDDVIVMTCTALQRGGCEVVLATNDVNAALKASANGVPACSAQVLEKLVGEIAK